MEKGCSTLGHSFFFTVLKNIWICVAFADSCIKIVPMKTMQVPCQPGCFIMKDEIKLWQHFVHTKQRIRYDIQIENGRGGDSSTSV